MKPPATTNNAATHHWPGQVRFMAAPPSLQATHRAMRERAQHTIRPRLGRRPDGGEVEVQGGLVREVAVVLDPVRLVSHHLGVSTVADRIRASTILEAAGRVDKNYRQYGVIISGAATTPAAVGQIVVSAPGEPPVRVADLGTVRYGSEDRFDITTGNGVSAALINVSRQPNGNMLTVERAVSAMIDSLRPSLPKSVHLESVYNQAALVRDSIANVRDAMLLGGLLAVVVLLLFLGRLGITLIAAITLPLAIAGTFAGLALFHDSLNLMSLCGLAVPIGLILDHAVVRAAPTDPRPPPHAACLRRSRPRPRRHAVGVGRLLAEMGRRRRRRLRARQAPGRHGPGRDRSDLSLSDARPVPRPGQRHSPGRGQLSSLQPLAGGLL